MIAVIILTCTISSFKSMLLKQWNILVVLVILFKLISALNCNNQSICLVEPGINPFTEKVIEVGRQYSNKSFTILLYAGNYNATNGTTMNFINFTNVTIRNHPDNTMPVNIKCPEFTDATHNGVGFEDSRDIQISGLNFMDCGPITSGLYFRYTMNVFISYSSFHHNSDNGIQIQYGNNINITGCHFYSNIGLQPDSISDFITGDTFTRGAGLGLVFEDQSNINVKINNCSFENNIAYKNAGYNSFAETRPYGFIPLGNGGGIYLGLHRVNKSYIAISNSSFTNNTAINQGGAIVMIPVDSNDNTLNISGCTFIRNKVLGYFLRSLNDTIEESTQSINNFIDKINIIFSRDYFDFKSISNLTFSTLSSSGGFGGAIAVSLFGSVEHNVLHVSDSYFRRNVAYSAGAIGFVVRDLLANVENGVDSNQAFIHNCTFDRNVAFSGTAIGMTSYSRVDIASLPIEIHDCTFKNNDNLRNLLPAEFERHFGISGTVVGTRFPVSFNGENVFQSNLGGGINMNHARVNVRGHMKFYNHQRSGFGGAVRLGELTWMHALPNTTLEFVNNSASDFGGAIGVDNFRGGNDTTLILNNMCFIQYNIGSKYEYEPNNWNVTFTFNNNTVTNQNGQGQAFFADTISLCVLGSTTNPVTKSSIFSYTSVFNFSQENKPYFETAPHTLILNTYTVEASLGEIFDLTIYAEDENGNSQDAVYSYYSPNNLAANPSNVIFVNLYHNNEDSVLRFASVNKATATSQPGQKISLVLHNAEQLKSSCITNYDNSHNFNFNFSLNLIDSSDGQLINRAVINSKIHCCHAAYEYKSDTGRCEFEYGEYNSDVILREERINRKNIYIRSDRYGGYDSDNKFVTVPIPPSYQNCTQEGKLPGCIVRDEMPDEQCSQGRTGFVCSKCSQANDDSNQGTALNLIECVPCPPWHIGIFLIICFSIVFFSFMIIYCNIGLPNALKGFLFFIQVVGYVYKTGVKDGNLKWDFYLSRFFGFSLYFPLCISSSLDTVNVAMLGFITPLLMAMCTFTYIVLARFIPHLSKRKTVDGIWFLILIAYVYTADTCLNLVRCVQVYEPVEFKGKRVYYFDGELECFKGEHLPYGVTAVIIAAVVLTSLPVYVLAICFNMIKGGGPLRDVMSCGIDRKCHWWSGYDLLRRLLFFIVYTLFENFYNDYTQFAIAITAILILMITSRIHPYSKKWINFVEGLILLNLVFISAYYLDNDRLPSTTNNNFVIVLLILPFAYFSLYLLKKILWRKRLVKMSEKANISMKSLDSVRKYWGTILLAEKKEINTSFMSSEDAIYSEYREELVTVEN